MATPAKRPPLLPPRSAAKTHCTSNQGEIESNGYHVDTSIPPALMSTSGSSPSSGEEYTRRGQRDRRTPNNRRRNKSRSRSRSRTSRTRSPKVSHQTQGRSPSPSTRSRRGRSRSPSPFPNSGAVEPWMQAPVGNNLYSASSNNIAVLPPQEGFNKLHIVPNSHGSQNPSVVLVTADEGENGIFATNLTPIRNRQVVRPPLSTPSHHRNVPKSYGRATTTPSAPTNQNPTMYNRTPNRERSQSPAVRLPPAVPSSSAQRATRGRSATPSRDNRGRSTKNSDSHSRSRSRQRERSSSVSRIRKQLSGDGTLRERLFGDSPMKRRESDNNDSSQSSLPPESILPRTLLTTSVFHNDQTNLWIATINTNQKTEGGKGFAAKYLRAFSYPTEREAKEAANAYAPPRMHPFEDYLNCFICKGKFAVFRRASHCRNCGVCVCNSCSTHWPSKMIPDPYNIKKEKVVKVCNSCNWLSKAFKQALLKGDTEKVQAVYSTGNINLRCAFKNFKGESMFPVHCAAKGGNLKLIKWLIEKRMCPIRIITTGNKGAGKLANSPLLTSKGRSVLSIAMENKHVDVIRYLVVEKNMSLSEIEDLPTALNILDTVLRSPPVYVSSSSSTTSSSPSTVNDMLENSETIHHSSQQQQHQTRNIVKSSSQSSRNIWRQLNVAEVTVSHGYESDCVISPKSLEGQNSSYDFTDTEEDKKSGNAKRNDVEDGDNDADDDKTVSTKSDACILCYEESIDCVCTPCGHQMCCLECSKNLKTCPVCNGEGSFIKIYKP